MQPGRLVAAVLAGSWRSCPPPPETGAEELAAVAPLLLRTGGAGLAWWRTRGQKPAGDGTAERFREWYLRNTLRTALAERETARIVAALREGGVEPLVVKGWSAARHYAARGLRPYGDLDLCVAPERHARAAEAAAALPRGELAIDLHPGYPKLPDRSFAQLRARSEAALLYGVEVRVPGPEDHLRVLAAHMLGHGAWRPLWLCDIAAALERRPEGFDWDYCLSGDARCCEWTACSILLAVRLLGANEAGLPAAVRERRLPRWLIPAVLKQWDTGMGATDRHPLGAAVRRHLLHPAAMLEEVRARWRNPIQASVELRAPFNELPRLPLQWAALALRAPDFARQLGTHRA